MYGNKKDKTLDIYPSGRHFSPLCWVLRTSVMVVLSLLLYQGLRGRRGRGTTPYGSSQFISQVVVYMVYTHIL